ncbi:hypothetical protein [Flammeovirga sp. SubArs3]|uniref:hypothetical protein n=1 Tax=Flammeovirga sp. SubArs3 TaxID=2995316 RepID=UPI00248C9683|nr:hypothetical protein [Flammeovirga sp. SubArs3]
MNKNLTKILLCCAALIWGAGCEKPSAFMENSEVPTDINITGLTYSEVVNARAYSEITSSIPTYNSEGIPCVFEILSVRTADGELDPSYLDSVYIASAVLDTLEKIAVEDTAVVVIDGDTVEQEVPVYKVPIIDPAKAGQIYIKDNNMFKEGDYYFTVQARPATDRDDMSNAKVFEDAFHLNVMPLLPSGLTYDVVQHNLVVGQEGSASAAPKVMFAKDQVEEYDFRYELTGYADTLVIDSLTGAISLHPDYTISKNEIYSPTIRLISNITDEYVDFEFTAEDFLLVVSNEALELNAGPLLPLAVVYSPFGQNLVVGEGTWTTTPDVSSGNPSVTFSLGTEHDKFQINGETGALSLNPAYVLDLPEGEEALIVYPEIIVTSKVSYEEQTYAEVVKIAISLEPYTPPREVFNFFYPSLATKDYYSLVAVQKGGLGSGVYWKYKGATAGPGDLAAEDRPESVTDNTPIHMHNIVYGPARSPEHDSWMIMKEQNLSQYASGFDLSAIFWMKNDFAAYQTDGRVAADMEIYVTDNYTGDVSTTNWTQVNDIIKFKIEGQGDEYTGTPYPGDQAGPDPDNAKHPERATYQKWLRYELDLGPYKDQTKFTFALRYKTYFTGDLTEVIRTDTGEVGVADFSNSSGKFFISDINYKAVEQVDGI